MAPINAKLCQNAFQTIPVKSIFGEKKNSARFVGLRNRFTPFWPSFGGSTEKRTSTANSSQFFALDALILRFCTTKNRQKYVGVRSSNADPPPRAWARSSQCAAVRQPGCLILQPPYLNRYPSICLASYQHPHGYPPTRSLIPR